MRSKLHFIGGEGKAGGHFIGGEGKAGGHFIGVKAKLEGNVTPLVWTKVHAHLHIGRTSHPRTVCTSLYL